MAPLDPNFFWVKIWIIEKLSTWVMMWWAHIVKTNLIAINYGHLKNYDESKKFNPKVQAFV
jgi:hypothetical protein